MAHMGTDLLNFIKTAPVSVLKLAAFLLTSNDLVCKLYIS